MSEWVSVKDKVPKARENVLVLYRPLGDNDECPRIYIGYRLEDIEHYSVWQLGRSDYPYNAGYVDVSHWMPLPGKPKRELFKMYNDGVIFNGVEVWQKIGNTLYGLADWLNSLPLRLDESANE